jgi:hypothetical protein
MARPRLGLPGRTGSSNKNTELGALNAIVKKLIELKVINSSISGGTGILKSNLEKLKTEANDLVETYTYLSPADPVNRRIDNIEYRSIALGLTVTETFGYAGVLGDYYVISSTLS